MESYSRSVIKFKSDSIEYEPGWISSQTYTHTQSHARLSLSQRLTVVPDHTLRQVFLVRSRGFPPLFFCVSRTTFILVKPDKLDVFITLSAFVWASVMDFKELFCTSLMC